MNNYGLLGKNISYSFSEEYFTEKFKREGIEDAHFSTFDFPDLSNFEALLATPGLKGLSVTIPYKEAVIPYLDELSDDARAIGAVNSIKIYPNGKTKGFNTDVYGFKRSIAPFLENHHEKALVLGTGGAAKAVKWVLEQLDIKVFLVSRNAKGEGTVNYSQLKPQHMQAFPLIVNASPVGTFPDIESCPDLPYEGMSSANLLFDLIYNPPETRFLKNGREMGANTVNGLSMLRLQAQKSWEIWQDN